MRLFPVLCELDFPVCGQYASDPGKIRVHPIYRGSFQRKQKRTSSKLRTGSDLFRKQVRFHRSYYFCGYGNRRMGTSGKNQIRFELRATGMNKNAAKYCGMKEKRNTIVTMMIAGGLAGLGAAVFYLSGIETWMVQQTTVPGMGFNGIAAAFLGGLNPIGAIFSSYFIQHITSGGSYVDKTMYCAQISESDLRIYYLSVRICILLQTLVKPLSR